MAAPTTFFIAIPARNAAVHLARALESVVAQDLTGIRVHAHVQDGGSTDGTIEIVREWSLRSAAGPQAGECTITWATTADGGMYDAITKALDEAAEPGVASGIFFWLNADDILLPGALRNLAATFADPTVEWVIGDAVDLDETDAVTLHKPHPRIPDADLRSGDFNYTGGRWLRAESTAVRLSAARACGPFTAGLRLAGDYDLFVKLARRGPPTYVDYPVRGFRRHRGQLSQQAIAYQHERARARFLLGGADAAPAPDPTCGTSREIVFYPDRTATDPYQTSLYAGTRARGAASLRELSRLCQRVEPLVVHVHWLDEVVDQEHTAARADARALAQVLVTAQARGHRIVFTLHEGCPRGATPRGIEGELVEFLFRQAHLVHMHHPAVAAEVRSRFQGFPWGRVVFAEAAPYAEPWALIQRVGLVLVGADGDAVEVGDASAVPAAFRPRPTSLPAAPTPERDAVMMAATIRNARWAVLGPDATAYPGLVFHLLAAGTPVIAPRLGCLPAYVFDDVNGLLYEPGDERSCLQAIERASTDRMAAAARIFRDQAVRSVAHLSWARTLDTIMRRLR